jgi:hypothetical protein
MVPIAYSGLRFACQGQFQKMIPLICPVRMTMVVRQIDAKENAGSKRVKLKVTNIPS